MTLKDNYALRQQFLIIVLLFLFVFLTTYPKYLEILGYENPRVIYEYFFLKIEHPLTQITGIKNDTHGSKFSFRFTVALLAKLTGFHKASNGRGIVIVYIIQSLLLLPFLFYLFKLLKRHTNEVASLLFIVSITGTYIAKSFFWDYDFWFDAYAYFFMLMGMYVRNKGLIFIFLQLACWTDERAVVALPGILIFHLMQENDFDLQASFFQSFKMFWKKKSFVVICTGVVYLVVRFCLSIRFNLSTPSGPDSGIGWSMVPYQLQNRLVGIALAFEGIWIVFLISMYNLWVKHRCFVWLFLIFIELFLQIFISYCVYDITRSLIYAYPLFVLSFILLYKCNKSKCINYLLISSLICLFIPTQFLIFFPRQIPWTIFKFGDLVDVFRLSFHYLIDK